MDAIGISILVGALPMPVNFISESLPIQLIVRYQSWLPCHCFGVFGEAVSSYGTQLSFFQNRLSVILNPVIVTSGTSRIENRENP